MIRFTSGLPVSTRFVSNLMQALLLPNLSRIYIVHNRNRNDNHMTRIAIALAAEKARTGDYPLTLEALSPRYFLQNPIDLFAQGSFQYRRIGQGAQLYSVGENQRDDGGHPIRHKATRKSDDIVLKF